MNNKIGKVIAETVYIHAVALDCIELSLSALVRDALSICAGAAPVCMEIEKHGSG